MKLEVIQARKNDIYRDIARISEAYRLTTQGTVIPEGRMCKISVGSKGILLFLRGDEQDKNPTIRLDEITRTALKVQVHDQVDFILRQANEWEQFLWAWNASDPAYRIAARLGLISVISGLIGLLLGIISLAK